MVKPSEYRTINFPERQGYFEIGNVREGNKTARYHLMHRLTLPMNQDELAKYSESEKAKGNPYACTSNTLWQIFDAASKLEGKVSQGEFAQLMQFIKQGLEQWPNTLSRVVYTPVGETDKVIHNYGTSEAYTLEGDVINPIGFMSKISNEDREALKLTLGTRAIEQINKTSDKINNIPMYFWRFNSKPAQKNERVVRFYASSDGLGLDCDGGLRSEDPAFRVVRTE